MPRVLVFALVLLIPEMAFAECMMPQRFLSPPAGHAVPSGGTVFLFQPTSSDRPDIPKAVLTDRARRKRTSVVVERVSQTGAFVTYALKLPKTTASKVELVVQPRTQYEHELRVPYLIRSGVPSAMDGVEIIKSEDELSQWTCSFQRSKNLTVDADGAIAFLLTWTRDGTTETAVLPPSMKPFFDGKPPAEQVLELGHVNCLGFSFDWEPGAIDLRVSALFSDNTKSVLPSKATRIAPPKPFDNALHE